MLDVILKRFDAPDERRQFARGRFEVVHLGGPTIGATRCRVEHVGLVLQGRATAAVDDGRVWELAPGTLFYIPPEPHDSWVLGDEAYVSLPFLGAGHYAK